MLRLLLLLASFGIVVSADAQGLPSAAPASVVSPPSADDSIKGVIWTMTARQVWNANAAKAPMHRPAAWATATEFKSWCNGKEAQADKSGLMPLRNQVWGGFAGNPASSRQLVDTIVANVRRAKAQKTELRKVNADALAAELAAIPGVAVATATTNPPADTVPAVKTAALPAPPQAQPGGASAATVASQQATGFGGFIAQNPAISLGLTFLLGMMAGALLTMVYRRSQQALASDYQPVVENPKAHKSKSLGQHEAHNQAKKEADEMKQAPARQAAPPTNQPEKRSNEPKLASVQKPPTATVPAAEIATPAPPAPTTWYAPAQEGGYIEERKLLAEALPQLPIMLTIDARNADRATFTLNPNVNQSKLIGDGLEQLRDYFEFALPGRISGVTAAAVGHLQRQGDGWQVTALAGLEVR